MLRLKRSSAVIAFVGLLLCGSTSAQFPSAVVGFNGPPIDPLTPNDVPAAMEMFQVPQTSGSTSAFIVANAANQFNNNAAFRASGLQTEGAAAEQVFFRWVSTTNPDGWVRLTTFGGTQARRNPALHVDGKVRFKLTNRSELFQGAVGVCLGIRESGVNVPQLADGGSAGTVEWVGVNTAPSVIIPGTNNTLDSTASGDDELRTLAGGAMAIVAGANNTLDSNASGDDVVAGGFTYTNTNPAERRPIPFITLAPSAQAYVLEWNLATGVVSIGGVPQGGGIAGFTGDGDLSVGNGRGTLEHIALTKVAADGATLIDFSIDELQFESPVADPILPPRVVAPIINGNTMITVTDIQTGADRVNLLRNHSVVAFQNVADTNPVVFDLTALSLPAAMTGETFTATQRSGITGQTSDESPNVTVLSAPSPYGLSIILDEDDDAGCGFTPPGVWESVGVTRFVSGTFLDMDGAPIFNNNAVWQTVDIPFDNPALVEPWLGPGDGDVDPSATGRFALDSVWIDIGDSGNVGPHELFLDGIQVLSGSTVLATVYNFENGVTVLNTIRGQSNTTPTSAAPSQLATYDGRFSHRIAWTYGAATNRAVGLLARQGGTCSTRATFPDGGVAGVKMRFRVLSRSAPINALPLPTVASPIVLGETSVTVTHDATATAVRLYVNGVAVGPPMTPTGTMVTFTGIPLMAGDSVSATQTIGGTDSDFAYPKVVLASPLAPGAPTISAPIEAGGQNVTVTGVTFDSDVVEIIDAANNVIGSSSSISPTGTVLVSLTRALMHLEQIRVRATNEVGTTNGALPLEVGNGNGDVLVCIGVRETNEAGPLGSPGGASSAAIEWIGASAVVSTAPQGVAVTPSNNWQTLTFDPANTALIRGFTGNGIIDVPRGTLEHLALTMNTASPDRSCGLYRIFIDNVINVGADTGGADFLLTGFEGFTIGQEVMFQEPTFSGTTATNLTPTPSSSGVSAEEGNPGQSLLLQCFFRDTGVGRWARITTSSTVNALRNPIIDLTKPIRFDILIVPTTLLAADCNCDGLVNNFDIDPFVLALSDPPAYALAFPDCDILSADANGDGMVNNFDIDSFVACVTMSGCP